MSTFLSFSRTAFAGVSAFDLADGVLEVEYPSHEANADADAHEAYLDELEAETLANFEADLEYQREKAAEHRLWCAIQTAHENGWIATTSGLSDEDFLKVYEVQRRLDNLSALMGRLARQGKLFTA